MHRAGAPSLNRRGSALPTMKRTAPSVPWSSDTAAAAGAPPEPDRPTCGSAPPRAWPLRRPSRRQLVKNDHESCGRGFKSAFRLANCTIVLHIAQFWITVLRHEGAQRLVRPFSRLSSPQDYFLRTHAKDRSANQAFQVARREGDPKRDGNQSGHD